MDLKSLIAKMDAIEKQGIVSEADAASENPFAPKTDPRIAAWERLTPAQKKWMGGADPTDPIILARLKSALPNEPDPTKPAAPAPAPAAPAAPAQSADATAAQNAAQQAAIASGAQDDVTGVDAAVAAQAASQTAPATVAAKPEKQPLPANPSIKAFQDEVLKTDPNAFPKFGADGRRGAEVNAAITKYPQLAAKYKLTPPAAPAAGTKPAPNVAGKPAPDTGGAVSPVPATADKNQPYWVNGTRYEWKMRGGGRGGPATGSWEVTATPQDKLQWNSTRARSMNKYTGPDDQYGAQSTVAAKPVKENARYDIAGYLMETFKIEK